MSNSKYPLTLRSNSILSEPERPLLSRDEHVWLLAYTAAMTVPGMYGSYESLLNSADMCLRRFHEKFGKDK